MAKSGSGIKARRKARFYASLRLAGITLKEWAKREKVTPDHVRMVLTGVRESRRLVEVVDEFIAKHLQSEVAA